MYEERPSEIPGAVVWRAVSERPSALILPDGCIDVIVIDGRPIVAGPDPVARLYRSFEGSVAVGLRFAPGQAPSLLKISAPELLGRSVPLEDVLPDRRAGAERLIDDMAGDDDPGAVLEAAFVERAAATDEPLRAAVVADLAAGIRVDEVARRSGLSRRQLQRRGREWFGYGPKHCSSILRLQRAIGLARSGLAPAAVAALVGYSDQAHLSRDTRRLAGETFTTLVG